jgi:hypothetical protein
VAEGRLNEFAPGAGDDGEEETLHKYARMWYNGDDATQQKVEKILDRMGWEIGELESEEGGCFVVRAGDVNGNSYIGFSPEDLTEGVAEAKIERKESYRGNTTPDIEYIVRDDNGNIVRHCKTKKEARMWYDMVTLSQEEMWEKYPQLKVNEELNEEKCPHCNGPMFSELMINEKKDACYYKVKSRYKVWPSAYASGALVKCRKKGASNWGNSTKNESIIDKSVRELDENLHQWFKEKWVRFGPDGKIRGDCARGDDSEGKPKCLPQSKAQNLGKKGRASAAARKRREDPNPERHGKAINVNTKKKTNESVDSSDDIQKIKDFINWSIKQLHIQKPYPKITLSRNTKVAQQGHHTGVHTEDNRIWVYIENRNLIDIFRTIFHELVHERQSQLNMIKDGDSYPGSPIEAMADVMAGKYIKIYGKDHPEIFQ